MNALYRKYRPQRFEDLVGQDSIRLTLLQALKLGRLSHAYLFSGPRGTGKTSTARLIARAIQCENRLPTGEACGTCELCQMNEQGNLVDLIEIDAASNRGIDEIRDLKEKIRFAPTRAKSKVYIIDEVHMLSKDAFNALLKTLEEPPPQVFFILATTEYHKIPETIVSRCQRYEFKRVSEAQIEAHLARVADSEGLSVEPRALALLARSADGGLRDALTLLDQFSGENLTEALVADRLGLGSQASAEALLLALAEGQAKEALTWVERVHHEGQDLSIFAYAILKLLREALHQAFGIPPRGTGASSTELFLRLKSLAPAQLLNWIECFDEAWVRLKRTSIATLPLEIAIVKAGLPSRAEAAPTATPQAHPPVQAAPVSVTAPVPSSKPPSSSISTPAAPHPPVEEKTPRPAPQEDLQGAALLRAVAKQLSIPSLQNSLLTARLEKKALNGFELYFSTDFHHRQVEDPKNFTQVLAAFALILGTKVDVRCTLDSPSTPTSTPSNIISDWPMTEEPLES